MNMERLFRAVVTFLYIRLGYRRVFYLGLDEGYDEGVGDGFQDAVDTVDDWYVEEPEEERPY